MDSLSFKWDKILFEGILYTDNPLIIEKSLLILLKVNGFELSMFMRKCITIIFLNFCDSCTYDQSIE